MAESTVWPKGYRCAVVLTVDYNDVHGILTQAPEVAGRDKTLSVWRYGTQRGVDRLLALFKELGGCQQLVRAGHRCRREPRTYPLDPGRRS